MKKTKNVRKLSSGECACKRNDGECTCNALNQRNEPIATIQRDRAAARD